mgnify:FL=1
MDIRVGFMKFVQERNKIIPTDGIAGADAKLTSPQVTGFHDLRFSAFDQVHCRFDVAKQCFSFRCQLYPFGASDKQSDSQFLFQYFDRLADS